MRSFQMFDTAVCVINCAIHKIIPGPEMDIINQSPSLTYLAYRGELGNLLLLPFLKQVNSRPDVFLNIFLPTDLC